MTIIGGARVAIATVGETAWFQEAKDPGEIDDWLFDLSTLLAVPAVDGSVPSYDPITGTPAVSATPTDITVTQITAAPGKGGAATAVGWWLSGGTAGTAYQLAVKVQTVGGRTIARSVWLRCEES